MDIEDQLDSTGWQAWLALDLKNPFMIQSWMRADDNKNRILMMPVHLMLLSDSSRVILWDSSLQMWNCWFLDTFVSPRNTLPSTLSTYFISLLSIILTKGSSSLQKSKLTLRSVPVDEIIVTFMFPSSQSYVYSMSLLVLFSSRWFVLIRGVLQSIRICTSWFYSPEDTAQKVCLPFTLKERDSAGLLESRVNLKAATWAAKRRVVRRREFLGMDLIKIGQ